RFPKAHWHRWEPAGPHHERAAQVRAFGRPVEVRYDLSKADVVVAIDSELLTQGPGSVRASRDFGAKRRTPDMNRVYSVESGPTSTATVADHRLQLPPAEIEAFLAALAQAVGAAVSSGTGGELVTDPHVKQWVDAVAEDLKAHRGASVVAGGEQLSPAALVLVHAINGALGNVGATVTYTEPVEADPVDHVAELRNLTKDMADGKVDMLLLLGGVNPVYTAPADLDFAKALQKVELSIHHGLYEDETSRYCRWHIPAAHELEAWGDARAYDGTVSVIQPLIEPLFEGKSEIEVLATFNNRPDAAGYELVQAYWKTRLTGSFDTAWRQVLHDGLVANSQAAPVSVTVAGSAAQTAVTEIAAAVQQARARKDGVTLVFRPDPTIYDGRYAPNVWLQELPKPLTK